MMTKEMDQLLAKLNSLDDRIGKLEQNDKKLDQLVTKVDSLLHKLVVVTILTGATGFLLAVAAVLMWSI